MEKDAEKKQPVFSESRVKALKMPFGGLGFELLGQMSDVCDSALRKKNLDEVSLEDLAPEKV